MADASATLDLADRTREAGISRIRWWCRLWSGRSRCGSMPASISRPAQLAYQTYGRLNAERSNAVLVLP